MEMSFRQYIDNPMGKRNAVFSQREMYKKMYTEKFNKIILREAGKIDFSLYIDKKKDRYYIHLKIPSETIKNFYYDAVVMFYTDDASVRASSSLQEYYAKFFSNDPAFVFTYLRVFLKEDMFFEDMKSKSSKLALTKDPKERNPYEIPGYSKILYFAYLYMKSKNLFSKNMYESYATEYDKKKLLSKVEHTDIKIQNRQEAEKEIIKTKSNTSQKKEKRLASNKSKTFPIIAKTKNVKKANSVKSVKKLNKK